MIGSGQQPENDDVLKKEAALSLAKATPLQKVNSIITQTIEYYKKDEHKNDLKTEGATRQTGTLTEIGRAYENIISDPQINTLQKFVAGKGNENFAGNPH